MEEDEETPKSIPKWVELEYMVSTIRTSWTPSFLCSSADNLISTCGHLQDRERRSTSPTFRRHRAPRSRHSSRKTQTPHERMRSRTISRLQSSWRRRESRLTRSACSTQKRRRSSHPRTATAALSGFCSEYGVLDHRFLVYLTVESVQGILGSNSWAILGIQYLIMSSR